MQADNGVRSGSVRRTSGRTASKGTAGAGQGAPPALSTRSRKSTASADLSKVILIHRRKYGETPTRPEAKDSNCISH